MFLHGVLFGVLGEILRNRGNTFGVLEVKGKMKEMEEEKEVVNGKGGEGGGGI